MIDSKTGKVHRDTAAECHIRAEADRERADGMDTQNGRRKFEESAARWDERGELLGRLEAGSDRRGRLDASSNSGLQRTEDVASADGIAVWEGEAEEVRSSLT